MRTQAKESQNDAKLERALVDSGTRAVDSLVTDGQDASRQTPQMKKLARKIKIRESGEIEVEKENAKRRAKKAKEKTKIEISEMRDDAERKKDAKDLELQKEQDDHKHKKRVREHELKKDERQHKAETKIKEISALTELFRILNDAKNQGILEEEDKALLRDRLSLSDSTKQTAEIHDDTNFPSRVGISLRRRLTGFRRTCGGKQVMVAFQHTEIEPVGWCGGLRKAQGKRRSDREDGRGPE